MPDLETGQPGPSGSGYEHALWCGECKTYHGPLYICPEYPAEVRAKITADGEKFRQNLNDPNWVNEQLAGGTPAEVIGVFRLFATGGSGPENLERPLRPMETEDE